MTDLKKLLFQNRNSSEEIATPQRKLLSRTSYSEELRALKKYLLWRSRFSENAAVLKKLLLVSEVASSFEKRCLCHTFSISCSYYLSFFLFACFPKSALNSIDIFYDLLQNLQFKGSHSRSSLMGSSLGSSEIGSSLVSTECLEKKMQEKKIRKKNLKRYRNPNTKPKRTSTKISI